MSDKALYHSPPRLTFVRHAETFANINKVWHGQTDTALTEHGHQQTQLLGQHFHHHKAPDVIIASPLQRTRITAEAIAKQHQIELQLDPRLMEFHLGDWEDTSFKDLKGKMAVAARLRDEPDFTAPNGESQRMVQHRMVEAIEEIISSHQEKNVVIVSHGVAIAIALAHYLHDDTTQWLNYNMNNTAIAELCLKQMNLKVFNNTDHLER